MIQKPAILVRRAEPGLGDQIGSTIAVRAAAERYEPIGYTVYASTGLQRWRELFQDQSYCSGGYVSCDLARVSADSLDQFDHVFTLDGIDEQMLNRAGWDPAVSKLDIWCGVVDARPENMCPRWRPTEEERAWAAEQFQSPYVVIAWRCSDSMAWKNYHCWDAVAVALAKKLPIYIVDDKPPDNRLKALLAEHTASPIILRNDLSLRQLGALLSRASLVLAPDSALVHFAAAVDVPCLGVFGGTSGQSTMKFHRKGRWIQGGIDPGWNCAGHAPCGGMGIRGYWCGSIVPREMAGCMEKIQPQAVVSAAREMLLNPRYHLASIAAW